MSEICLGGCLTMYGKHVNLCIKDYAFGQYTIDHGEKLSVERKRNYQSAKDFLFDGGLEDAIDRFGIDLDAGYVKKVAKECALTGHMREEKSRGEDNETGDETSD